MWVNIIRQVGIDHTVVGVVIEHLKSTDLPPLQLCRWVKLAPNLIRNILNLTNFSTIFEGSKKPNPDIWTSTVRSREPLKQVVFFLHANTPWTWNFEHPIFLNELWRFQKKKKKNPILILWNSTPRWKAQLNSPENLKSWIIFLNR